MLPPRTFCYLPAVTRTNLCETAVTSVRSVVLDGFSSCKPCFLLNPHKLLVSPGNHTRHPHQPVVCRSTAQSHNPKMPVLPVHFELVICQLHLMSTNPFLGRDREQQLPMYPLLAASGFISLYHVSPRQSLRSPHLLNCSLQRSCSIPLSFLLPSSEPLTVLL